MTDQTTTEKPLIMREMQQKSLTYELTAADIKAMRKANKQIYFFFNFHPETGYLGRISLEKMPDPDQSGFQPTKERVSPLEYTIDVPAFLRYYAYDGKDKPDPERLDRVVGIEMLYPSSAPWETALEILRKGDKIKLEWGWNDFGSELIKKKGLISDSLHLTVHRPNNREGHDDWVQIYLGHSVTENDRFVGMLYYRED